MAELGDEEWLSQYLTAPTEERPRDRPRDVDAGELSLIRGRLSPAAVRSRVRVGSPEAADGARYVQVGALRSAGFTVRHTPNPRNPDHVSVTSALPWGDREAVTFVAAFTTPVWFGDEGGAE